MSTKSGEDNCRMPEPRNLRRDRLRVSILLGTVFLITVFMYSGLMKVPFHPDESTYLFMSSDFRMYLKKPLSLSWSPDQAGDLRTHYRLIDPPLPRNLIGFGLDAAGLPTHDKDWDWSKTWEENRLGGSFPSEEQLRSGRAILVLLIPFDLLLIYSIGRRLRNSLSAGMAMVLFGTNALLLLHARRAMTEALLIFGVLFALWIFLNAGKLPWLAGVAVGIAMNSKLSAAALVPVGLYAIALPQTTDGSTAKGQNRTLARWAQFIISLLVFTVLFNPFLWKHPLSALHASVEERRDLLLRQRADYKRLYPESNPNTAIERTAALLTHLFISQPVFAETANYQDQTQAFESSYLRNPGNNLFRGMVPGSLMMVLSIFGLTLAVKNMRSEPAEKRQAIQICLLATLTLTAAIWWILDLPWQRYVLPLVPLSCIWAGYGSGALIERIFSDTKPKADLRTA